MKALSAVVYVLNMAAVLAAPLTLLAMIGKFLEPRPGAIRLVIRYASAWFLCGNIIYIGDPVNILAALPAELVLVRLGWRCRGAAWISVTVLFYTLTESVAATLDAAGTCVRLLAPQLAPYAVAFDSTYLVMGLVLTAAMAVLMRLLPRPRYAMSARVWRLVGLLAVLPLVGVLASVALVSPYYDASPESLGTGMLPIYIMLPLFSFTALALLYTAAVLAGREQLEQAVRLADLRAVYYQGLRRQEEQVRCLRHDLRNHLSVLQGLLETGAAGRALAYVRQMSDAPALQSACRFCGNEVADVVLSVKTAEMKQAGITADVAVSLPEVLPVTDTDLCALLGNALDNAAEGTLRAAGKRITVRCRAEKGLLMLQVRNPAPPGVPPDLSTTKADRDDHGFGIPGMREITERYGGTLEAGVRDGQFELLVCLPL